MDYTISSFGKHQNEEFDLITITNNDVTISFSNLGARINQWQIGTENIVLGFNQADQAFHAKGYYYGATIGRVGGRISQGRFTLNGDTYQLPQNEGDNHHHGGPNGFDLKTWDYEIRQDEDAIHIDFSLVDEADENGYPGKMEILVTHSYDIHNRWTVTYKAQSNQDTLFNPTNHVYFNLNGTPSSPVTNHQIQIQADSFVQVNADGTPSAKVDVEGTAFDLRQARLIENQFKIDDEQLQLKEGYDHPFVLNNVEKKVASITLAQAELNRSIEVTTDRDAVVIYTHNVVDPAMDIWEVPLQQYSGIAIETQILPDAINHDGFGNIILEKDTKFYSQTSYKLNY